MREKNYERYLVSCMLKSKHKFVEIEGKTYVTLIGTDEFDMESYEVFNLENLKKSYGQQNKH